MSRTLSAGLSSHISGRSHTRCNMLRLDLNDETAIGITDHDKSLDFDLGDGEIAYDSGTGILSSDISLSAGLDADNFEVTGPIADTVTLEGVLGGRFNRARVRLFQVNWKALGDGAIKLLAGNITEARVEGGRFVFEVRSDKDHYNQTVGRTISNVCDADFGDTRCGITPATSDLTVTAGTSALQFTASFTGTAADDFFNKGTIQFLTGDLASNLPVEIEDWEDNGDGTATIKMFAPFSAAPAVGDTATATQGCFNPATGQWKSRSACMHFNNIANFRGFPEVPGRKALMPAVPGA